MKFWLMVVFMAWCASLVRGQDAQMPPAATHPIDFRQEIRPILETKCLTCHGRSRDKGGFRMDTRELVLKGGSSGEAVVLGNSAESYMIELVAGLDPDNIMPAKGKPLTTEQVGLLRAWVDQGMKWPAGQDFTRKEPNNLHPRNPDVPEVAGLDHPADRLLHSYFAQHGKALPSPVEDRLFARRAWLDAIGLLPPPDALAEFEADRSPDKRERLVHRLLARNHDYAQHWLTFWNDLLRNDYKGPGYIDNGREQITPWLYESLVVSKPYDQFVRELVDPNEKSRGFIKGIVWRGVVNASQRPEMQASQNISQVFLGVNVKCASCHDSFINDYTLKDAYGLAAVYAEEPLEIHECNKGTGRFSEVSFLYPQLGSIDGSADLAARQKQLAGILTGKENGRLSRTIVNRLWARLLGHGLVEPVDEMDKAAWSPDLLDWLAEDLVAHGWDLRHTLARIMTSRAYQLPVVDHPEEESDDYVFHGPAVRRLTSEQFRDAMTSLTGVGYESPVPKVNLSLKVEQPKASDVFTVPAKWIWNEADAGKSAKPGNVWLRKSFVLEDLPSLATAVAVADNSYTLWVNGSRVVKGDAWTEPNFINLRPHLQVGENVIAIQATNGGDGPNPAGAIFYARLEIKGERRDFASDSSWKTGRRSAGWEKPGYDDAKWVAASELGDLNMAPWSIESRFASAANGADFQGHVRASLANSDELTRALGRPNRTQVMTDRDGTATTLQAIELTNGDTLANILQRGAARLVVVNRQQPGELIEELFSHALARSPSQSEANLSEELVGKPVRESCTRLGSTPYAAGF